LVRHIRVHLNIIGVRGQPGIGVTRAQCKNKGAPFGTPFMDWDAVIRPLVLLETVPRQAIGCISGLA
jgi:hypothetical protein